MLDKTKNKPYNGVIDKLQQWTNTPAEVQQKNKDKILPERLF